jgi:D-alanine-D-alanine ligase
MRILVLLGGDSTEREVSQVSGRAIAAALLRAGHDVQAVDTAGGRPVEIEGSVSIGQAPPPDALAPVNDKLHTVERIGRNDFGDVDVVFVALHGTGGEDGTVQALLEMIGVPYTGSGVMSSSVAMDKEISKRLFRELGVPTPPGFVAPSNEDLTTLQERIDAECGWPVVVKPNSQGSSVGVHILPDAGDLAAAVGDAARYDERLVFETFIPGRELTVAVLDGRALPVVEIAPKQGFYDYRSKYTPGNTEYHVPADIPPEVATALQHHAEVAFAGLRCRDFARVDFRMNPGNQVYCLEVNTIPGMTPTSLVPKAAAAADIDFDTLVDRIVRLAAARGAVRSSG